MDSIAVWLSNSLEVKSVNKSTSDNTSVSSYTIGEDGYYDVHIDVPWSKNAHRIQDVPEKMIMSLPPSSVFRSNGPNKSTFIDKDKVASDEGVSLYLQEIERINGCVNIHPSVPFVKMCGDYKTRMRSVFLVMVGILLLIIVILVILSWKNGKFPTWSVATLNDKII
jgi:hypothetical protein